MDVPDINSAVFELTIHIAPVDQAARPHSVQKSAVGIPIRTNHSKTRLVREADPELETSRCVRNEGETHCRTQPDQDSTQPPVLVLRTTKIRNQLKGDCCRFN